MKGKCEVRFFKFKVPTEEELKEKLIKEGILFIPPKRFFKTTYTFNIESTAEISSE